MAHRVGHRARWARVLGIGLALLLALLLGSSGAGAAGAPAKLSLKPVGVQGGYFTLTMNPGETRQLTVELLNSGGATTPARTYPADAYTLVNGGFGARLDGQPTSGTTRWIDYQAETLDLAPGKPVTRTFHVAVPAGTKPGEYLTSLVIQHARPVSGSDNGGISLSQVVRQVIAVSIDVPGPRTPALAIGGVSDKTAGGKSVIRFEVDNPGNVRLKPAGEFTLADSTGAELSHAPVRMDSVYAGDRTALEIPLDRLLDPGDYVASLSLKDATTGAQAASGPLRLTVTKPVEPTAVAGTGSHSQEVSVARRAVDRVTQGTSLFALAVVAGVVVVILVLLLLAIGLRRRRPRSSQATATRASRRLRQVSAPASTVSTTAPRARASRPESRQPAPDAPLSTTRRPRDEARPADSSSPLRRLRPPS